MAAEAKSLLKRVVDEHPGTPWADMAQDELSNPFGFKWVETSDKPAVREAEAAVASKKKQKALPDLAESAWYYERHAESARIHIKLAAEALGRASHSTPGTAEASVLLRLRGDEFALRGSWERAAACYSEIIRFSPEDIFARHHQVLVLLAAGDRGAAQRAGFDLLDRFHKTTTPWVANHVAWCLVLDPGDVANHEASVRLAEIAAEGYRMDLKHFALKTLGAALYRAGRFEDAIRWLEERVRLSAGPEDAQDWAFLAMAHHRLGHRDEARRWLDCLRNRQPSTDPNQLWDELEIRLLRSEAEALVLYDPVFPADPFAH